MIEILDVIKHKNHVVNAIIHFSTTGMHTFPKINMNLIQKDGTAGHFFWCVVHGLPVLLHMMGSSMFLVQIQSYLNALLDFKS